MPTRTATSRISYKKLPTMDDMSIYESILTAVIDQRLTPGTHLTEAELCSIYGTSRRRIERVLVRLEAEGVVTIEKNRGAYVARPTTQDARDVFALRRLVESEMVRLLSGQISAAAHERLLASFEAAHSDSRDAEDRTHIHHSGDFHILLAEECGNFEIKRLVRRLVARTSLITQLFGNKQALDCWHHEHVLLVELLKEGATEKACLLMEQHLDSIEGALRLAKREDEEPSLRAALLGTVKRVD